MMSLNSGLCGCIGFFYFFFFSSRRRHTRFDCDWRTCALPICLRSDEEWDNLESIIKNAAYTIAKCAAYRQGLGIDFSRLRPLGAKVLNSANESTGSIRSEKRRVGKECRYWWSQYH